MEKQKIDSDFDKVGMYSQDEVNGFSEQQIKTMVNEVVHRKPKTLLDCMAGDGNLAQRVVNEFINRGLPVPEVTVLEYSEVQCQIAEQRLQGHNSKIWPGDVLSMRNHKTGEILPDSYFDCVMIKSSNHEIPKSEQTTMYSEIHRVLKPGGTFVNLGFAFEDEGARDDVRNLALCKDRLAGMTQAVANRYFLLRDEFYTFLNDAGFSEVENIDNIDYRISASRVAKNYFKGNLDKFTQFKDAIVGSRNLQRLDFIEQQNGDAAFKAPGQITIAIKS